MARQPSLKMQMKTALSNMACYGESKHADKIKTNIARQKLKDKDVSYEDRLAINYSKDKIYSLNTMKAYQHQIDYFYNYLCEQGKKKVSWSEAQSEIQPYLDHLAEEGKSAWTINLACASLSKCFGTSMHTYTKPSRCISDIKRSSGERKNDARNQIVCAKTLHANSILGLRRSELQRIRVGDFSEVTVSQGRTAYLLQVVGKGGKHCKLYYYDKESQDFIKSLIAGRPANERVFEKEMREFDFDADYHAMRQQAAKRYYQYMIDHPEDRSFYLEEIQRIFAEDGKKLPAGIDFESKYIMRGKNKEAHEQYEFQKLEAMAVSLFLNHYRLNVSINSYLAK